MLGKVFLVLMYVYIPHIRIHFLSITSQAMDRRCRMQFDNLPMGNPSSRCWAAVIYLNSLLERCCVRSIERWMSACFQNGVGVLYDFLNWPDAPSTTPLIPLCHHPYTESKYIQSESVLFFFRFIKSIDKHENYTILSNRNVKFIHIGSHIDKFVRTWRLNVKTLTFNCQICASLSCKCIKMHRFDS